MAPNREQRFHGLDLLRCLAAYCVVFWHWGHFFKGSILTRADAPLFQFLSPLYLNGWQAVDLFFTLSGFVFFWKYHEQIRDGMPLRTFAILRLSRIYPLHLATLVFVALFALIPGAAHIYPNADPFHFFLNTALLQTWGLESGWSFNGPSWSVSVEEFCYAAFFLLSALRLPRRILIPLGITAGLFLLHSRNVMVGRGVFSFFIGGAAFMAYQSLQEFRPSIRALLIVSFAASYGLTGAPYFREVALFPALILLLALAPVPRALGRLGDLSFAVYLLHYPLQLVALLIFPQEFFTRPLALCWFFVTLTAYAALSFYTFETPVKKLLRRQLLKPAPAKQEKAACPHCATLEAALKQSSNMADYLESELDATRRARRVAC